MSLWSFIRSRFARSTPVDPLIRIKDDGFEVVEFPSEVVIASVKWVEVARIQAYKLDLVTTDCICLLFEFTSPSAPLQVSEEWMGFNEIFSPLTQHFPAIPESWYEDIMIPAFETNRTVLFDASIHSRSTVV
jgi:hypothetical protein